MPNIPVYNQQTQSPVAPLVQVPTSSPFSQGIQELGQSVAQGAGVFGEVVSNAVYGQELDKAKIDYAKMREQFIANMREKPLIANRDENGRLIDPPNGFGHINELRTKEWEKQSDLFMKQQKQKFSHGRAKTDFESWASGINEQTRGEVNQNALSEQLAFIAVMRGQDIQDAVESGNFTLAEQLVYNATEDGAYDLATAKTQMGLIDDARIYQGQKQAVFTGTVDAEGNKTSPGYTDYENPLDGLEQGYANIAAMDASDANKAKLTGELESAYTNDVFVTEKRKEAANEEGFDEFGKAIETGKYANGAPATYTSLLKGITDDERLNASTRIRLYDRLQALIAANKAAGASKLDEDMKMLASEVWGNPYYTDQQVSDELYRLSKEGKIDEPTRIDFMRMDRKNVIQKHQLSAGTKQIQSIGDELLKNEKDEAKRAQLKRTIDMALHTFSTSVAENVDWTDEDIQKAATQIVTGLLTGELEAGETPKSTVNPNWDQGGPLDKLNRTAFENGIAARAAGEQKYTGTFPNALQATAFLMGEGKNKLLNDYGHIIKSVGIPVESADRLYIEFPVVSKWGGAGQYRFAPSRNGKDTILQRYNEFTKGWELSNLDVKRDYEKELRTLVQKGLAKEDMAVLLASAQEEADILARTAADPAVSVTPQNIDLSNLPAGYPVFNGFPDFMLRMKPEDASRVANIYDMTFKNSFEADFNQAKRDWAVDYVSKKQGGILYNTDRGIRAALERVYYPASLIESAVIDVKRRLPK